MKNNRLYHHLQTNVTIYFFITTLFLTGIVFGSIIVGQMEFVQKQDLFFHLERYFNKMIGDQTIAPKEIWRNSFFFHLQYIGFFFLLGLTIIGLPVIWFLIFMKGTIIGFSVGFIVHELGVSGLLLAMVSIAPQNLLIIPAYIAASSMAMIFSMQLIRKLMTRHMQLPLLSGLMQYILVFCVILGISYISALIEAYVANEAMVAFLKSNEFFMKNLK